MDRRTFLGLDLSTQSLKALVVDLASRRIVRHSIPYDGQLPHYGTRDGVPPSDHPTEAMVDPLMWAEALDRVLLLLKQEGLTGQIAAVSVAAQQHGSVYFNGKAAGRLRALKPGNPLHEQLAGIFSRPMAPIWMDASTGAECREISEAIGSQEVVRITGSPATERFAGPQVRKFWKQDPVAYADTAHIALISSFVTGLLIGGLAPLDCGDGLGTNLVDVGTRNWSPEMIAATAPGLGAKLPQVLDRDRDVGAVSEFLCRRYGFNPRCRVVVGTGDNPASLVGLGLVGDDSMRAVSLGTSDTYFGCAAQGVSHRRSTGHVFGTADGGLMFLICFKNGSLARDAVRARFGLDWKAFSRILLTTPPGNGGRLLLPYFTSEITPVVLHPGVRRFGGLEPDDMAGNVRAVAEAQIMSMVLHSDWAGPKPIRILVTAGGSENQGLLTLIAQVFGADVRAFEVHDSSALGAALRAAGSWLGVHGEPADLSRLHRDLTGTHSTPWIRAAREETAVYQGDNGLLEVYAACERRHLGQVSDLEQRYKRFLETYPVR